MLLKSVSSSKFNVQCNTVRYTIHFSGQCQVQGSNVILLRYTLYLLGQGQVQSWNVILLPYTLCFSGQC
jgi:hypothetical protein